MDTTAQPWTRIPAKPGCPGPASANLVHDSPAGRTACLGSREAYVLFAHGQVRPLAVLHGVVAQQVQGRHQRRPRPTGEQLGGPLQIKYCNN